MFSVGTVGLQCFLNLHLKKKVLVPVSPPEFFQMLQQLLCHLTRLSNQNISASEPSRLLKRS